jgi:hypothetical protein
MFKVMYVRTRSGNPYLHTYRTNSQRTEFEHTEANQIAGRLHGQHVAMRGTDIAVVPADQDCPDYCPLCGADLKCDGYPLAHKQDSGDLCPITWGCNTI